MVTETNARTAADTALQTNIDVERARIDSVLSGAAINLDTFVEIATAFQNADTTILTTISALDARVTAAEAQLAQLTA